MDTFFKFINAFPMPLWLAMMFAPEHPLTERASRSTTIFAWGALQYVVALVAAMRSGSGEGLPDFTTLEGIRQGLSTREGALAGWAHMLALDLFTGAWIYRQCRRLYAPAWIRIPALFLTLMAGPFGLLIFLIWRALEPRAGEALPELVD